MYNPMSDSIESIKCDLKRPKRVLHFSDGVLEEYDSDEEERDQKESSALKTDKQMILKGWPMVSMLASSVLWLGSQTLSVCDYIGENLANFLGITSAKYEYEIQEYNRRLEEQKRYESRQSSEFSGWGQTCEHKTDIDCTDSTKIPKPLDLEKQKF